MNIKVCPVFDALENNFSILNGKEKRYSIYNGVTIPLPFEEYELLKEAMSSKVITCPVASPQETLLHLTRVEQRCYQYLPEYIHRQLLQMKLGISNPSYFLIKGFPQDELLPSTPLDGSWSPQKDSYVSEALLLGIAMMLGLPYGFKKEKDGRLINQISPVPGKEESQSSASATIDLGFHAEIAYEDVLRPRFLVLSCLRQDKEKLARTNIVDMRNVLGALPGWAIDELRKAQYQFKVPDSFSNSTVWVAPKPILSGPLHNPEVVYDAKACRVIYDHEMGLKALQLLEKELNNPRHLNAIRMVPGDILVIPNFYTVHGRSHFIPKFDGEDRWLVRVYVTDSIFASREKMTSQLLVFDK